MWTWRLLSRPRVNRDLCGKRRRTVHSGNRQTCRRITSRVLPMWLTHRYASFTAPGVQPARTMRGERRLTRLSVWTAGVPYDSTESLTFHCRFFFLFWAFIFSCQPSPLQFLYDSRDMSRWSLRNSVAVMTFNSKAHGCLHATMIHLIPDTDICFRGRRFFSENFAIQNYRYLIFISSDL